MLKYSHFIFLLGLVLTHCASPSSEESGQTDTEYHRVISLSGALTETMYVLGHGDKLVGIDVTSTYPAAAMQLPRVGHVSQLNPEGLLGLQPDLIVAEDSQRDNPVLGELQQAGVEILYVPKPNSLDAPLDVATAIAEKLGDPEGKLEELSGKISRERQQLTELTATMDDKPRVLFLYARGKGNMMVAGKNTSAETMINAAGGANAVTAFEDFRALSAEGLMEANPDVILLFESGLESLEGEDSLLELPGMAQTPAGKNRRFVAMDGHYLLGFGPRAPEAAIDLAKRLRGEATL